MKIIVLGAPGSGKGTQSAMIVKMYNTTHLSMGDALRKNIKEGTDLGLKAKEYMDKGLLVPDDLVIDLLKEEVKGLDACLLDGFPRTIEQAKALDAILDVDKVLYLDISKDVLLYRISGRRLCKGCPKVHHTEFLDDKKVCFECGGELYQRDDDTEEVVAERLRVFEEQTKPLIEYYEKQGKLKHVRCGDFPHETFENVVKALEV